MPPTFAIFHIPALGAGVLNIVGGAVTLLNPRQAVVGFGFPARVADSVGANGLIRIFGARTTVLGVLILVLYARDQLAAVDTVLTVLGIWSGIVDGYAVFREGDSSKALMRLVGAWSVGFCGLRGMTQGA